MQLFTAYLPYVARLGKRFARLAVVDGSLIKLSLAAFSWAHYQKASGAAKMTAVYKRTHAIPQQLVFTTGKINDARALRALRWAEHWTYVLDCAYLGFEFLAGVLASGAQVPVLEAPRSDVPILSRAGLHFLQLRPGPTAPISATELN